MPVLLGTYPIASLRQSLEDSLSRVKSQNWLAIPEGVRVEALNIAGSSDDFFANAIRDLKHDIFLGIQGAILQSVEGSVVNGRGDSQVHRGTANLFVWYLAQCIQQLLNDRQHGLIKDLIDLNFVADGRYPRAVLSAVEMGELLSEMELDQKLWSMGMPLSMNEMYEKYGRRPPEDEADTLLNPQFMQQAAASPPGPAMPQGQPPEQGQDASAEEPPLFDENELSQLAQMDQEPALMSERRPFNRIRMYLSKDGTNGHVVAR